jgi:colicin import membrane protein
MARKRRGFYTDATGDDGLSKGLRLSFAIHAAFLLLLLIRTFVLPGDVEPFTPSLRVDIVDLPDQLKNDIIAAGPKPEESAPKPKEEETKEELEEADPDEMALPSAKKKKEIAKKKKPEPPKKEDDTQRKKKMDNALARIKALQRLRDEEAKQTQDIVLKGNKLSKGSSVGGDARESAEISYNDLILERVRENWELPVWMARQNLAAQVQITLDEAGRVTAMRFLRPSGNPQFDDAVRQALKDSDPFPNPPEELRSSVSRRGIILGFPL